MCHSGRDVVRFEGGRVMRLPVRPGDLDVPAAVFGEFPGFLECGFDAVAAERYHPRGVGPFDEKRHSMFSLQERARYSYRIVTRIRA